MTRIYIARGDIASAMRWAEGSVIEIQNEPENWHIQHMFEYLTSARIRLARGAFDEALALLDRLRQFAEAQAYSSIFDQYAATASTSAGSPGAHNSSYDCTSASTYS